MNVSIRWMLAVGLGMTGWMLASVPTFADAPVSAGQMSNAQSPKSNVVEEGSGDASKVQSPKSKVVEEGSGDVPGGAKDQGDKSARETMQELLNQRKESPVIEPTRRAAVDPVSSVAMPSDPRVLGVAPGQPTSPLRREGEFVVNRRGRLVRASSQGGALFVFQGDGEKSPELPMVLIPCQLLQSMEELVQERGDKLAFIVSGQVLTYRGANYLMPTMMTIAVDKGNLQH